jgi:hypothetical protein
VSGVGQKERATERQIPEADWTLLRRLEPVALDRFCRRTLAEVAAIAGDEARGGHDRYRAVYQLVQDRDAEVAAAFGGTRRSTARVQLVQWRRLGLVTDAEFAGFGDDTRAAVGRMLGG